MGFRREAAVGLFLFSFLWLAACDDAEAACGGAPGIAVSLTVPCSEYGPKCTSDWARDGLLSAYVGNLSTRAFVRRSNVDQEGHAEVHLPYPVGAADGAQGSLFFFVSGPGGLAWAGDAVFTSDLNTCVHADVMAHEQLSVDAGVPAGSP